MRAVSINLSVPFVIENLAAFVRALLYVGAIVLLADRHYEASVIIAMASYAGRFWGPIQSIGDIYNQLVNFHSQHTNQYDQGQNSNGNFQDVQDSVKGFVFLMHRGASLFGS